MQANQETIKAAAKRMCTHLATKGVDVKQTQMLEALAQGLGLDNWRTLKAVIDQPRKPKKKSKPLGTTQLWAVDALYRDNNQQYGDDFPGRTALEAAYCCMVERLTDDGLEVDILDVFNADKENCLSPSFVGELALSSNRDVLETVHDELQDLADDDKLTKDEALAFKWLAAVLERNPHDDFERLTDYDLDRKGAWGKKDTITVTSTLTPEAALQLLVAAVEVAHGGIVALESADEDLAKQLYQLLAICENFSRVLNDNAVGGLAFFDLET